MDSWVCPVIVGTYNNSINLSDKLDRQNRLLVRSIKLGAGNAMPIKDKTKNYILPTRAKSKMRLAMAHTHNCNTSQRSMIPPRRVTAVTQ